ncbi:MAG: collagen binding domain-containing protein [Waddliaceae bacterium]
MKRAYLVGCFFLMFVCLTSPCRSSDELLYTGTLIVTYQTDAKAERLERIRFWLKDDNGKQHLYPMGNAYVEDSINQSRMVVIEDLLPGQYTLEFLVPNTDGYFAEVHKRRVVIAKGDVAKIDQQIKHRKTYWERKRRPNASLVLPAPSQPKNVEKEIAKDEKKERETAFGKLIVSFDTQPDSLEAKNIRFKLIDSQGNSTRHPDPDKDTEIPLRTGSMVVITNVAPGDYSLAFFVHGEDRQTLLTTKPFSIEENKTKSVHQSFALPDTNQTVEESPHCNEIEQPALSDGKTALCEKCGLAHNLSVMANIPTAVFHLQNEDGSERWNGKGRLYTFENLKPGAYKLSFESYDPFFIPPEEKHVEVAEKEENQVEAIFNSLGKIKILANVDGSKVVIDDINYIQDRREVEISDGMGVVYLPEGEYRLTFSKSENGRIPPQPVNISVSALHTREINVYFAPSRFEPKKSRWP